MKKLIFSLKVMLLSAMISALPQPTAAQEPCPWLFDCIYSDRGQEVIEVHITDAYLQDDGQVVATLAVDAKTALTYGFAISVEQGTVTPARGTVLETLLGEQSGSIPFFGRQHITLGTMTFSRGATLRIRLDKLELAPGDAPALFGFDALTSFSLLTGNGYIPQRPGKSLRGTADAFEALLGDAALDSAALSDQLQEKNWSGALKTLSSVFVAEPELISSFLSTELDIETTPEAVRGFGMLTGHLLPVIGLAPIGFDLVLRPDPVQVDIDVPAPEPITTDNCIIVTAPTANLRIGPGTGYATAGSVQQNDRLALIGQSGTGANAWYLLLNETNDFVWIWSGISTLCQEDEPIRIVDHALADMIDGTWQITWESYIVICSDVPPPRPGRNTVVQATVSYGGVGPAYLAATGDGQVVGTGVNLTQNNDAESAVSFSFAAPNSFTAESRIEVIADGGGERIMNYAMTVVGPDHIAGEVHSRHDVLYFAQCIHTNQFTLVR